MCIRDRVTAFSMAPYTPVCPTMSPLAKFRQMALINTIPISKPMRNSINIMAAKPEMVVRLLAEIAGIAALRAEQRLTKL